MLLIELTGRAVKPGEILVVRYNRERDRFLAVDKDGESVGYVDPDKHSFEQSDFARFLQGVYFTVARISRRYACVAETVFSTRPRHTLTNADRTVAAKPGENSYTLEWISKTTPPARRMTMDESIAYLRAALSEVQF